MTETTLSLEDSPPDISLSRLLDRHGAWATLRALATTRWHRRIGADALPDHLRRDIGLPDLPASPRYWDVR